MDEIIKLAKELYPGSDIESRYNRVVAVELLTHLEDERKNARFAAKFGAERENNINLINL